MSKTFDDILQEMTLLRDDLTHAISEQDDRAKAGVPLAMGASVRARFRLAKVELGNAIDNIECGLAEDDEQVEDVQVKLRSRRPR